MYTDYTMDRVQFKKWLSMDGDVPDKNRDYTLKAIRMGLQNELTDIQRAYLLEYLNGMTMPEIAMNHGVHKSTVSRTITRGKKKIEKVIRYSNPAYLEVTVTAKRTNNTIKRRTRNERGA